MITADQVESQTVYSDPTEIANTSVMAGNRETGLKYLELALDVRDPNLPYLGLPLYDELRDHARFREIARKMGLPLAVAAGSP